MTILIISVVLLIAGTIVLAFTYNKTTSFLVGAFIAIALSVGIVLTPVCVGFALDAKSDEAIWNDMVANPTCYSTELLAKAHKDIATSKYWATTPFGFHKGYDFPEINVDVMEDTKKYHFVK